MRTDQELRGRRIVHREITIPALVAVGVVGFILLYTSFGSERGSGPVREADAVVPSPSPDPATLTSRVTIWEGAWPQSTSEEIDAAQRGAAEGAPAVVWQTGKLFPSRVGQRPRPHAVPSRFFERMLGWELADTRVVDFADKNREASVVYIRCEPGAVNTLYRSDAVGSGCSPTLDDVHYETVWLGLERPAPDPGSKGVWLVTRAEMLPPADDRVFEQSGWETRQYQQAVPPTLGELFSFIHGFLDARIAGEGAGRYLGTIFGPRRPPLLYRTGDGSPYVRADFTHLGSPRWPDGSLGVTVRLFAEDRGVVVRQALTIWPEDDGLRIGSGVFDRTVERGVGRSR